MKKLEVLLTSSQSESLKNQVLNTLPAGSRGAAKIIRDSNGKVTSVVIMLPDSAADAAISALSALPGTSPVTTVVPPVILIFMDGTLIPTSAGWDEGGSQMPWTVQTNGTIKATALGNSSENFNTYIKSEILGVNGIKNILSGKFAWEKITDFNTGNFFVTLAAGDKSVSFAVSDLNAIGFKKVIIGISDNSGVAPRVNLDLTYVDNPSLGTSGTINDWEFSSDGVTAEIKLNRVSKLTMTGMGSIATINQAQWRATCNYSFAAASAASFIIDELVLKSQS